MRNGLYSTVAVIAMTGLTAAAAGASDDIKPDELLSLSLEQLSNIEVTSVSKRSEKASEAAAAIFVITGEDISRSGATSIPEVLRIVPGLSVAQSSSHQWAISSRGFNDQFSNKLLVLIDGRSIYTPLFSGVYWDIQDVPLQDIERIEVIRGPGATLWGANAVNGVINILTKDAKQTQGGLASATVGSYVNSMNTLRYGAKIDDNAHMRAYAKYDTYGESRNGLDQGNHDDWKKGQVGFRADWKGGEQQSLTLQGDMYQGDENRLVNLPYGTPAVVPTHIDEKPGGFNLLGRWNRKYSSTSDMTFQAYFDEAQRDTIVNRISIKTYDLDMQHVWTEIERHELVWGLGYRRVESVVRGNSWSQFSPEDQANNIYSTFVQDKISLVPNSVFLTLGSKFERNDFTLYEYQPSARLSWLVDDRQTLWGSVSRAVRIPDISAQDIQLVIAPLAPNTFLARLGDSTNQVEKLIAYELGYRIQPQSNMSLDLAAFYNDYDQLFLGAAGPVVNGVSPVLGAYTLITAVPVNAGSAHSWGVEGSAKWNPVQNLELAAGYTLLQISFDQADPFGFSFHGKTPQQQFNLRSTVQLPHDVEFNTTMYYVDSLESLGVGHYTRLDTRLAWKPVPALELSVVGQNLLDTSHQEFSGFLYQNTSQIPRSIYANLTWKF